MKRAWLVLPDLLSIRTFFDTGVVDGLRTRLHDRLTAVFLVPRDAAEEWTARLDDVPVLHAEDVLPSDPGMRERAARRADAWLDERLGYYPLAIRLNERHGFHLERMQPGHPNWMLDSARRGPLPRSRALEAGMQRWFFSARRHIPSRLARALRDECSGLVLSNVQPHNAMPFLAGARRFGRPVVAHVASWDHTVGKGVISPYCRLYVVQNEAMRDDLCLYHGIAPDRVRVTGWPQTDVFAAPRPRGDYEALLAGYGLDASRPLVLFMGNTPTNAPYEGELVARVLAWWEATSRDRFQLLFRPHPRDRDWRQRFRSASDRRGVHLQQPSYTDLEELAVLLRHGDAVVANAGTILLDALVNDRPVVCVLYDEGAPVGEAWASKNVVGKHYEELAASGAFYRAERFEDVTAGIERALADPAELAEARRAAVRQIVGDVDGHAAERVVDAIASVLGP